MPDGLSTPMAVSAAASLLLILAGMFLVFWRLARGPALLDRIVALDLFASLCIGMIVAYVALTGLTVMLNAAVILALTAFLGTVAIARFMERSKK
jgi:multicomponent Na+:H+ antiporter subunit F